MKMTMYDTLLQLPLFQGLGKNDFTNILDKVKIHFSKHKAGETILREGQLCNELVFLLNGTLIAETTDRNHLYVLCETVNSPTLLEPYSLFGWSTKYTSTYIAQTNCNLVTIEKAFLLSELNNYEIIRLNYLNILSNRIQNLHTRLWNNLAGTMENRIIDFVLQRCLFVSGEKRLKIKMDDWAKLIAGTRIRVSKTLNDMQDKQWLTLHRGEVRIPDIMLLKEMRDRDEAKLIDD